MSNRKDPLDTPPTSEQESAAASKRGGRRFARYIAQQESSSLDTPIPSDSTPSQTPDLLPPPPAEADAPDAPVLDSDLALAADLLPPPPKAAEDGVPDPVANLAGEIPSIKSDESFVDLGKFLFEELEDELSDVASSSGLFDLSSLESESSTTPQLSSVTQNKSSIALQMAKSSDNHQANNDQKADVSDEIAHGLSVDVLDKTDHVEAVSDDSPSTIHDLQFSVTATPTPDFDLSNNSQPLQTPVPHILLHTPASAYSDGHAQMIMPQFTPFTTYHDRLETLGSGGMGIVYLAHDKHLNRKVAYKQIRPDKAYERALSMRFLREAQINAQLDHPGVAPLYSMLSSPEGLPAYTMKVVRGKTLNELLQEARNTYNNGGKPDQEHAVATLLEHFLKVCDAMAYAHSKGVLHRDLKPDNIMIGQFNEVYVVDWGVGRIIGDGNNPQDPIEIAHLENFESVRTRVGQLVGTPQYMSPEQAQGKLNELDARSDLYSLGIILFEIVFLRRAIIGDNLLEVVDRILTGRLNEMKHIAGEHVPFALQAIIRKSTAKDPDNRYNSVGELADDLRRFLRDEPILAAPERIIRKIARGVGRFRVHIIAFFVLLVMALLGFNMWFIQQRRQDDRYYFQRQQLMLETVTQTARDANKFDQRFYMISGIVKELATSARITFQFEPPEDVPHYLHSKFQPPDLVESLFYRDKVSLEWPLIKLPPNMPNPTEDKKNKTRRRSAEPDESALQRQLLQIALLRPYLRRALFSSLDTEQRQLTPDKKNDLVLHKGALLTSAFVATRDGIIALYPGRGGYSDDYDPRQRPWFIYAQSQTNLHWGPLYLSTQKISSLMLSCAKPIIDEHGKFIAVTGVDLQVHSLAGYLNQIVTKRSGLQRAMLLDYTGRIIAQNGGIDTPKITDALSAVSRPIFSNSVLIEHFQQNRISGYFISISTQEPSQLIVYSRLQAVPWYFVTISHWPWKQ